MEIEHCNSLFKETELIKKSLKNIGKAFPLDDNSRKIPIIEKHHKRFFRRLKCSLGKEKKLSKIILNSSLFRLLSLLIGKEESEKNSK